MLSAVPAPPRNVYDHLIRDVVTATGDRSVVRDVRIPPSTARTWKRRGMPPVVSSRALHAQTLDALRESARLRRKLAILSAVVRLLLALLRANHVRLDPKSLLSGADKTLILHAVARARRVMPLSHVLRVLRMPPNTFHTWRNREQRCALDDIPSCPRSQPGRITAQERFTLITLATGHAFAHMSTRALALFAQRQDLLHLAPGTWHKLVRKLDLRRPRTRIHPRAPTEGLRAQWPGQILHVDVTVIRLLDGSRAYIQAVPDNFSRMIVAYAVTPRFDGALTAQLLRQARSVSSSRACGVVLSDDGREDHGTAVTAALSDTDLTHWLAQQHVTFSNSMIEALWRSMKHNFLCMQRLATFAALERFVAFHVEQHNTVMPHAAFHGQTPQEVFEGVGTGLRGELADERRRARELRIERTRRTSCERCPRDAPDTPPRLVP